MSGKKITKQQVKIYMKARKSGKTQVASAAKASFSERSGRSIEKNQFQLGSQKPRDWKTRSDPFEEVWDKVLCPQLENAPGLSALTLLEFLQEKYPGNYPDSKLRTLQRRVKQWKATKGPEKELIIRQIHEPGVMALSDFTKLKNVVITINGVPFNHLLYHFRLAYSGWSFMQVVEGGESYTALTEGIQNALWQLGGSPKEHRTDHLSAASKNSGSKDELTERYFAFCDYYNMKASFNNLGRSHENGGVEGPHGHLKRRIEQALLLRNSYDFSSVPEYTDFIKKTVANHNRRNAKSVDIERGVLEELPSGRTCDYDNVTVKVSTTGTINFRRETYSLPSRLKGEILHIHLYDNRFEAYLGTAKVYQSFRVRPKNKNCRTRTIQLEHVIETFKKKPGAFRGCVYRDDLFPNDDYYQIWKFLERNYPTKFTNKYMVGLLDLSLKVNCKIELACYVLDRITNPSKSSTLPTLIDLEKRFIKNSFKQTKDVFSLDVKQHDLSEYDECLDFIIHNKSKTKEETNYGECC
jgi:transposase InsO family protein